jgi:hypothetical protein
MAKTKYGEGQGTEEKTGQSCKTLFTWYLGSHLCHGLLIWRVHFSFSPTFLGPSNSLELNPETLTSN